jgi:hypothetical protein
MEFCNLVKLRVLFLFILGGALGVEFRGRRGGVLNSGVDSNDVMVNVFLIMNEMETLSFWCYVTLSENDKKITVYK